MSDEEEKPPPQSESKASDIHIPKAGLDKLQRISQVVRTISKVQHRLAESASHQTLHRKGSEIIHRGSHSSLAGSGTFIPSRSLPDLHRPVSTTSLKVGKGDSRMKHCSQESLQQLSKKNKLMKEVAIQAGLSQAYTLFKKTLDEAGSLTFRLKKKLKTESPLMGKTGYLVFTDALNSDPLGMITSCTEVEKFCGRGEKEDAPIHYQLVTLEGEELLSLVGLTITPENDLSTKAIITSPVVGCWGSIVYGYPEQEAPNPQSGVDIYHPISLPLVPTSVQGRDEEQYCTFKRAQRQEGEERWGRKEFVSTELISVDESGETLAEVFLQYKAHSKKSQIITNALRMFEGSPESFKVNFIEALSFRDKALLVGVTIALFNQWIRRKGSRACSRCGIA